MTARIFIGTSSWSDASLIECGRYYPAGATTADERLRFFAQEFTLAEVDSSYYALPSARNSKQWIERTPANFAFIVKAFAPFTAHPVQTRSIPKSHRDALPEELRAKPRLYAKDLPPDIYGELWEIFRRAIWPISNAGKLGAVLLDFPPWFHPTDANRAFLTDARERVPEYPLVVEFRAASWVGADEIDRTLGMLSDHAMGFVCIDEPHVSGAFPPVVAATAEAGMVRFRGRNAETWNKKGAAMAERLNHVYDDAELREWLPRIVTLASACERVLLAFNTKFEDQGIVNARRMAALLPAAGLVASDS